MHLLKSDGSGAGVEPCAPNAAADPVLNQTGLTWNARSSDLTSLSTHLPGDGSFQPYPYFTNTNARSGAVNGNASLVPDDWTGTSRWANNWCRYHVDQWLVCSKPIPAGVYTQIDAYLSNMDPVLSAHNDADNTSTVNGKQFNWGAVIPGFGYSAADIGYTPPGAKQWRDRIEDLLDGNVSGSLGSTYRQNHNYRASAINAAAAMNAAWLADGTNAGDDIILKVKGWLDAAIVSTFPDPSGTRNLVEENRQQSIHYDLLELYHLLTAVAHLRWRGLDISTTAAQRITARAAAMWPHYEDYHAAGGPIGSYVIGGVTRSEIGNLYTTKNEGPPMEWMVALGFHPGPVPAVAQGKESPFGFTGKIPG